MLKKSYNPFANDEKNENEPKNPAGFYLPRFHLGHSYNFNFV